jgi:hypothetical protein
VKRDHSREAEEKKRHSRRDRSESLEEGEYRSGGGGRNGGGGESRKKATKRGRSSSESSLDLAKIKKKNRFV